MPSALRQIQARLRLRAEGDQARAIPELVEGLEPRRSEPGAAGRDRVRQDLHDGQGHRSGEPADARDGPQQDPGGAALSGIPPVLSRERGRVFRQLLRLLPAGGLRPVDRLVHREGSDHQRRDRSHAPVGHAVALRAPRRHHRRRACRASTAWDRPRRTTACCCRCSWASGFRASRFCRSSSKFSTSATTSTSRAAPSACAATSSRCIRRTKNRRCASSCSATTSTR